MSKARWVGPIAVVVLATLGAVTVAEAQSFTRATKSVSPDPVREGDTLTYTINMENTGSAGDVVLTDTFDACLDISTFNPATDVMVVPGPAMVSYAAPVLTVDFGLFGAGDIQVVTITGIVAPPEGIDCCNQGVIDVVGVPIPFRTSDPTTGDLGDPTCRVSQAPLSGPDFAGSTKEVSPSPATSGQPITYTLTVTNSGTSEATDVVIGDTFAGCLDDSVFDALNDVTVNPGPADSIIYDGPGRRLTIRMASIPAAPAAGSTQTITIDGLLAGPATASCCNKAELESLEIMPAQTTDDPSLPGADDSTCVEIVDTPQPSFARSIKTIAQAGPLDPGDAIDYTIIVSNSGTGDANNVVINDVLPDCVDDSLFSDTDVTIVPGPGTATYTPGTRTLRVDIPTLASAASQTITITNLTAADAPGACCNQAEITSDEVVNPVLTDDDTVPGAGDPTCVDINNVALPNFAGSVKASAPDVQAMAGEPVTYTIDVTNSGNVDATNVILRDTIPDCVDDSLFDASLDVTVNPGPPVSVTYDAPTRLLTVEIATMPPMPAVGASQLITISNLTAGVVPTDCCNQGEITSDETPTPVLTDGALLPGNEDPTCFSILEPDRFGPDLLRNAEWPGAAKADIFSPGCLPPLDLFGTTLDPSGIDCLPEAFPGADDDDLHVFGFVSGDADPEPAALDPAQGELFFYQVDARIDPVGNTLRVVKRVDPGDPTGYVIEITY